MESADRHQRGDDRRCDERGLHEAGCRARGEVGQDRRRRGAGRLDPGLRGSRRDRPDRRLTSRSTRRRRRSRRSSRVPLAGAYKGKDLRVLRRRRRVDALLLKGRLRELQAPGRLPREVRQVARRAAHLDEMMEVSQFITDQLGSEDLRAGPCPGARQPGNYFYFMQAFAPSGSVLRPEDDGRKDQRAGGRQGHERDPQGARSVSAGKREVRLSHDVDDLAQGRDGDALYLAADGPYLRELRAARQGVPFLPKVADRRQGGLCGGAREERVVQRGRQVRLGGLGEIRDAAYLFTQWDTSPSISWQRVMFLILRDPYRISDDKSKSMARSGRRRPSTSRASTIETRRTLGSWSWS